MTENNDTRSKPGPKPRQTETLSDAHVNASDTQPDVAALMRELEEAKAKLKLVEAEKATAKKTSDVDLTPDSDNIVINVVTPAGITYLAKHWPKGSELEVIPGSPQHKETFGLDGKSWLDLRDDPNAQEDRWGEVKFRSGLARGRNYVDPKTKDLSPEALEAAARLDRKRARSLPDVPHTPIH